MQVQLPAPHLRLFTRLNEHTSKRNRTVGLLLDSVQKALVTGLLSRRQGVVVDLEVIGEEVRPLCHARFVHELVYQFVHLLDPVFCRFDGLEFGD